LHEEILFTFIVYYPAGLIMMSSIHLHLDYGGSGIIIL